MKSIVLKGVYKYEITNYEEIVGKGMLATIENITYKIGSLQLMDNLNINEQDKNTRQIRTIYN